MFLNQELLQTCEEFFDQIANTKNSEKLDNAICGLRTFLEKDVDGFTQHSDEKLAYAAQSRLHEIWRLISKEEKNENQDLADLYVAAMNIAEDVSGYEADDINDDDDECFWDDSKKSDQDDEW